MKSGEYLNGRATLDRAFTHNSTTDPILTEEVRTDIGDVEAQAPQSDSPLLRRRKRTRSQENSKLLEQEVKDLNEMIRVTETEEERCLREAESFRTRELSIAVQEKSSAESERELVLDNWDRQIGDEETKLSTLKNRVASNEAMISKDAAKLGVGIDGELTHEALAERFRTPKTSVVMPCKKPDAEALKKTGRTLLALGVVIAIFYFASLQMAFGSGEWGKTLLAIGFALGVAMGLGPGVRALFQRAAEDKLLNHGSQGTTLAAYVVTALGLMAAIGLEYLALSRAVNDTAAVALDQTVPWWVLLGAATVLSGFYTVRNALYGNDLGIFAAYDLAFERERGPSRPPESGTLRVHYEDLIERLNERPRLRSEFQVHLVRVEDLRQPFVKQLRIADERVEAAIQRLNSLHNSYSLLLEGLERIRQSILELKQQRTSKELELREALRQEGWGGAGDDDGSAGVAVRNPVTPAPTRPYRVNDKKGGAK